MRNCATYTAVLAAGSTVAFTVVQPSVKVGSFLCVILPVARAF
jgi:hypothetical protein